MEFRIVEAKPSDIETAYALFRQSTDWLKSKGLRGFDASEFYFEPSYVESVKRSMGKGEFFFVHDATDNSLVGMFKLQFQDEFTWAERGLDEKTAYIHALRIDRDKRGQGLGYLVLAAVEKQLRKKGIAKLRIDCNVANKDLCGYYEKYGFVPQGAVFIKEYNATEMLFEKPIT